MYRSSGFAVILVEEVNLVAEVFARIAGGFLLATAGWRLGEFIIDTWGPQLWIPWVPGLALGGALLGVAATPYVTVRAAKRIVNQVEGIPTSRLLSALLGILIGLIAALLLSIPLSRLPGWWGIGFPIGLSIFLAYLGFILMASPSRDVFHRFVSEDSSHGGDNGRIPFESRVLLDTSAIIDGRISEISNAGFLRGKLVVPQFILDELRHIADSSDSLRRNRGRRGLEILNKLREQPNVEIEIMDVAYRNGHEVDSMLVEVAKELNASIATTDYNLNRVAQIQGITVLNVNELANSVRPVVLPGEGMSIHVVQEGKEPGQGVGFLDDGTMVVVEGGNRFLNNDLDVLVTRVLQTAAGCIIFAQPRRS